MNFPLLRSRRWFCFLFFFFFFPEQSYHSSEKRLVNFEFNYTEILCYRRNKNSSQIQFFLWRKFPKIAPKFYPVTILQAEEAQRLRRKRKADRIRLLDMQQRQMKRLEEVRETQKKVIHLIIFTFISFFSFLVSS